MDTPVKEPAYGYHYLQPDDEIGLFELGKSLWAQKTIIIATTVAVTLIAAAAAFRLPPIWQAETRIYQGSQANLAQIHSLQQIRSFKNDSEDVNDIGDMTPEQAFHLYYRYLSSPATLRSVFHESGLAEQAISEVKFSENFDNESAVALANAFEKFKEDLSIQPNEKRRDSDFFTIQYNSRNQQFSADLINNYLLPIANAEAIAEIKANIANDIEKEKALINHQVFEIESSFVANITAEKIKITHAQEQAESAGIEKPSPSLITVINDASRFIVGWKVLSKQLEQANMQLEKHRFLSRPVSGDEALPLLPHVLTFHEKLERLNRYAVTVDKVKLVIIDEPAMVPAVPVRSKKVIMIALGVVIGGVAGICIVLIRIAIARRKE